LPQKRKRSNSREAVVVEEEILDKFLSDAIDSQGLPVSSATKLRLFITSGCMPLPAEVTEALEAIKAAVAQLRQNDSPTEYDPRRLKRFEDVGRSLKQLTSLVHTMHSVGVGPRFGSGPKQKENSVNRPLYVSIDLGLRQRRKHFHGQVFYQCIAIPGNYFEQGRPDDEERETNETLLEFSGRGLKVAEGGRYDELVRKYRPPGNFGSALFNYYTTAPITKVRIHHFLPCAVPRIFF
jgi:hypothetical protein